MRRSAIMYRGGKPAELYHTTLHCLRHTEGGLPQRSSLERRVEQYGIHLVGFKV